MDRSRDCAAKTLGGKIELGKEIELENGSFQVWVETNLLDGPKFFKYEHSDGAVLEIESEWRSFEAFLRESRFDLANVELLTFLFEIVMRGDYIIILEDNLSVIPAELRSRWKPPLFESDNVRFFCFDENSIFAIRIAPDYHIEVSRLVDLSC